MLLVVSNDPAADAVVDDGVLLLKAEEQLSVGAAAGSQLSSRGDWGLCMVFRVFTAR